MADALVERVERWAIRGSRVDPGHVPGPERMATGLVGVGLLMLSRRDSALRVPAAMAAGAVLTRAVTGICPMYAALERPSPSTVESLAGPRGQHIREEITIAQPPDTVFAFWRTLTSLSAATRGRVTVEAIDELRSRWALRTRPDGPILVEWTAELINEVPDKVLGWRTVGDADVVSAGSVAFAKAPGNQGTEVRVHLQYAPPMGRIGSAAATVTGQQPAMLVREALRDVKRYLELGRPVVLQSE